MYVIIIGKDNEVLDIIKDPTDKQKEMGPVINSLNEVHQFTKIGEKLYYIKEIN